MEADLMVSLAKLSGQELARPEAALGNLRQALEIAERLESQQQPKANQRGWPAKIRRRRPVPLRWQDAACPSAGILPALGCAGSRRASYPALPALP
jgi:hypothetical protein